MGWSSTSAAEAGGTHVAPREGSYAFAEHGRAGRPFLVMMSGPPVSLVANAVLSKEDAEVLSAAMSDGLDEVRLGEIDRSYLARWADSRVAYRHGGGLGSRGGSANRCPMRISATAAANQAT